jgi:hypothetical protein
MGIGPLLAGLVISFTDYRGMYMGMAIVGAEFCRIDEGIVKKTT